MLGLTLAVQAGASDSDLGAALPDGARKVAEHRYRAQGGMEATLKFYKARYSPASYPRKTIANQPGVKAVHIANPSGTGAWEGLNIYEANDEVRIYVVPADGSGKKTPKKK
jgi:hypothetical protein